jgi:nicotinamide/nicotinate riboside kinase
MVIGIGGISNAGKSFLADKIKQHTYGKSSRIICQDDFVKPKERIPKINGHVDWECPESMDFNAFREEIAEASFSVELVIAEGILCFFDPAIDKLFDKRIFLWLNKETFNNRKKVDLRWGLEPEWYIEHIWNSFIKFGQPENTENLLKINADQDFNFQWIYSFLDLI